MIHFLPALLQYPFDMLLQSLVLRYGTFSLRLVYVGFCIEIVLLWRAWPQPSWCAVSVAWTSFQNLKMGLDM